MKIYLNLSGTEISLYADPRKIISDTIEFISLDFLCDEEWASYQYKVAQFTQGSNTFNKPIINNSVFLPTDAIAGKLLLRVFGYNAGEVERAVAGPFVLTIIDAQIAVGEELYVIPPTPDLYSQLLDLFLRAPYIDAETKHWFWFNPTTKTYEDTGESAATPPEIIAAVEATAISESNASDSMDAAYDSEVAAKTSENIVKAAEIVVLQALLDTTAQKQIALDEAAAAAVSAAEALNSQNLANESAIDAGEFAGIAANNILNGVDTHNIGIATHADIRDEIRTVETIARGRATSHVFATYEAMADWMMIPENLETLQAGDNLYIEDTSVYDYWWTGTVISELEAEAPDLTDYYLKPEVDALLPITILRADYDVLLAGGTVEAGRRYDIIEAV